MPSWRHSTPMSPGEKLDPLPDPFILQPPVFHPVLPYVTTIFGGLRAGKMVMLQGAVPLEARRFQVDFQCGCSLHPRPDIAIHFNPRFHTTKPHVICNTLHLERWQAEARWPHLPLQRGAYFLILFLFGNEEMKVSVNGQHFLHYCYRLPLSRVDTLAIFGDILVEAVGFLNINPFLLKSPSLEVPCSRALPRGLWPGQVIVLRGLVLPEPKDFTLSLRDEAAHVPVTLRASFADRTLAWISPWGGKKLISAPFLFYPQRFFEVSQSHVAWSLWGGAQSCAPMRRQGCVLGVGRQRMWGWEARTCQQEQTSTPRLSTVRVAASEPTPQTRM
ncbi:galectin-12 isoform X3 [Mirounga angustirostris]|uniref:galectin-12 isoform X3 n=1 Tax=Mirounga angustirostris TaxID=9716 RepID=UPI001E68C1B0|nr:galectin-12 isoform X3 [Mirounga angustirostris]